MYIKIKNLKRFLLAISCISLGLINYMLYVKADTQETAQNLQTVSAVENNDASLTNLFTQSINDFINAKGNQTITPSDIQNFTDTTLVNKLVDPATLSTLPEVDRSKIKVLSQSYTNLNEKERKVKMQQDAVTYLTKVIYLAASNSPMPIVNPGDFAAFKQDFENHVASLGTYNPDTKYFSDLGDRLTIFLSQVNDIEVPESMVDLHIKALRIIKGFLQLKESPYSFTDPLARQVQLTKTKNLIDLTVDFFQIDFKNYFDNLAL